MASVLDGVRVLDLSWGIAGPIAGMLLADHGADVVKIEPPGGDPFRGTAGYDVWLRGRRSVVLNLNQAGDPNRSLPLAGPRRVVSFVQSGHDGGAVPYMLREEPFLPELEIPDGMEPGSPRPGPI